MSRYFPGLAVVVLLALAARFFVGLLPDFVSEVTVGVVLGIVLGNSARLPAVTTAGVRFATTTLLRLGIVLLGARLAFGEIVETGGGAIVLVVIAITTALTFAVLVGRWLDMPPRLAALIGVGTAICGNSAIVATAPVLEADEREVSYAVATITLFGTVAILVYPLIGLALDLSDPHFGYWAGAAVNDTSQVTATGFAYSQPAGEIATIVKLTRNTFIAPVLLVIAAWYARSGLADNSNRERPSPVRAVARAVPLFVIGFIAAAIANSLGVIPEVAAEPIQETARFLILMALVAVGLSTNVGQLRALGARPLALGFTTAILLSVVVLGLSALLVS